MIINILLVLGTLAVIGSWVVAVHLVRSDKFSGTSVGTAPATESPRVLANSAA